MTQDAAQHEARMDEAEKRRRLEAMTQDAAQHEARKDDRIAASAKRDKEQEELEAKLRQTGDQRLFKEMRSQAYGGEGSMADRLQTQRNRRQRNILDPLERD